MADERYEFYDDDYLDGAAVMVLRGRKERLNKLLTLDYVKEEETK